MSVDKHAQPHEDRHLQAFQHVLNLKHDLIDLKHAVKRARKSQDYSSLAALFERAEHSARAGRLFAKTTAAGE
ncbi:hypothetical protein [Azotobacter vinelandii]